jgi:hypothetical protein
MDINMERTPAYGRPSYSGYNTYKIAEKVSAHAFNFDGVLGISKEVSESFGLIGECGGTFGITPKFITQDYAVIAQAYLVAGLFYHQPSFRIYTMGGIGLSRGVFGYPNVIEDLENGKKIVVNQHGDLLNSGLGLIYRGSVGFDYKLTPIVLLGLSYAYTRSNTTVTLENKETFYISDHAFAAMIGLHM